MKIAFVGSSKTIDLNRKGGVESTIRRLSIYLKKQKYKVTIYQINKEKKGVQKIETPYGFINICYNNKRYIRMMILKNHFDVINFIQTPFEDPIFTLIFLIKKFNSKTITTKFFFTYPPFRKYKAFESIKYKFLIDKSFVLSYRLLKEVKSMTDRVYFLYPPIKKYFFNLKHSQPKNNKIRVMYAGRLSKDKGIDLVIDIFKCLDRNKYHLSLIGYFNNHKDIEKYKKTISTLQIDELDISESAKKSSLSSFPPYEHCDILLLPYQLLSPTLDLPLILLEGMVAGCKVITSKIGDIPHLKGNVYDVQDYTNARAFIDMIEKKSNVKIKKYNYKNISLDFIGKKYLDCLFEDEL